MNRPGGDAPPPSKETLRKAAQVRIDVLTGSIQGLGFGLVAGAGGWPLVRKYFLKQPKFADRKFHIFATLCVGAFGSFIGSLASARNSLEVALGGMESEHVRRARQDDEAFARRRQALLQQRGMGGGDGGSSGGDGTGDGGQAVLLDDGSAFGNHLLHPGSDEGRRPPQPPSSRPPSF